MVQGLSITLVIPCYNEGLGLPHVLQKVPPCIDEVIIVDNNSTDDTVAIALEHGAIVLPAPVQGYGAAYKVGFAACKGDIVVTLDGDGTYPVEEIEQLVAQLIAAPLDFISACRFPLQNPENMDRLSRIGNWGLTLAAKVLFGYGLQDSQSGMWVFRRSVLSQIRLESDGMPLSEEIKIEVIKRKLRFREIHIPYHLRFGEKKIRKFRDGFHNLWFLVYLRLRS
jgi:glycosyltransferase involved in cell wall biosynthesis